MKAWGLENLRLSYHYQLCGFVNRVADLLFRTPPKIPMTTLIRRTICFEFFGGGVLKQLVVVVSVSLSYVGYSPVGCARLVHNLFFWGDVLD